MSRPLKVNKDQVKNMIDMYSIGVPCTKIGKMVGVHHTTVMFYVKKAVENGIIVERKYSRNSAPSDDLLREIYSIPRK